MFTYREQLDVLSQINLRSGGHSRVDCPFCSGRKTLSISNVDGKLLWHCYKASCPAKGAKDVGRTTDQIRGRLDKQKDYRKRSTLPLPDLMSDPSHHNHVLEYLESNGSHEAYEKGDVYCTYAPAEDRVLFFMPDRSGAVGRSLSQKIPKWKAYGDTSGLLTVGTGDIAVVVEDAPSACAVSRAKGYVGAALMGTNVSPVQKRQLKKFSKIIIALDKDASRKSLSVQRMFQGVVPCSVRLLDRDCKHMTTEQIKDIII